MRERERERERTREREREREREKKDTETMERHKETPGEALKERHRMRHLTLDSFRNTFTKMLRNASSGMHCALVYLEHSEAFWCIRERRGKSSGAHDNALKVPK